MACVQRRPVWDTRHFHDHACQVNLVLPPGVPLVDISQVEAFAPRAVLNVHGARVSREQPRVRVVRVQRPLLELGQRGRRARSDWQTQEAD
eukprot:CAMPEP_0179215660 /NCGR_PEP_ID=MMETSP0797-20121207/2973_1 /TAXON_ID=47934 /ORGANISM="Dinophysis acuminata, Strain DAEP01" /LENGTH=90 /DNA_ID=CAMNT_0020921785 /DNA_START=580 /DNA_END=852 /DNA_ORIENTATION=+